MVLSLKYGDLSGLISESSKLANELGQYCDELSRKVQQKMYSVEGGMSSALNSADYYVNQKISQLRTREANARNLVSKAQTLLDTAKRVDEDVEKTIQANQTAFFNENPKLRPPEEQNKVIAFLTGIGKDAGNGVKALGALIGEGINAVGQVLAPLEELGRNIRKWWEEGGWKVAVTVVVGVVVAAALIFSGGMATAIGLGLLGGLVSQTIGDILSGKTSSWESYVGSALGGAVSAWAYATGNAHIAGALSSGVATFSTKLLELVCGDTDESIMEITMDTVISSVVGAIVGKVVDKAMGALSKTGFIKKIFQDTRLEGKWDFDSRIKEQLTKLAEGTTKYVGWKTVRNVIVQNTWGNFKRRVNKYVVDTGKEVVMNNVVTPLVDYAKGNKWLAPIFDYKAGTSSKAVQRRELIKSAFDIYRSLPQLKAA